jgi:hypothetical protein
MSIRTAVALVALLVGGSASAQSAEATQAMLNREAAALKAWGGDRNLVDAVKVQNGRKVALAEIQRVDGEWTAGKQAGRVKEVTTGPCADYLRTLVAKNPAYGEAFVMDNQGAIVCATAKTSDYWQGDEAKWTRAFDSGKGAVFIDRPRFDDSAKARLAQISVPVVEGGKAIGAVTVGVNVDRLK